MPLARRLPKRGFTNIFGTTYAPVNVSALNRFEDGARKLVAYNTALAYPVGIVFAAALLGIFLYATRKQTAKA